MARNDCIYTFSMDGVEGAGPLPRDAARSGRARPDQSYLDAGAPAQAMLPCLAPHGNFVGRCVTSMPRDQSICTPRAHTWGLRRHGLHGIRREGKTLPSFNFYLPPQDLYSINLK